MMLVMGLIEQMGILRLLGFKCGRGSDLLLKYWTKQNISIIVTLKERPYTYPLLLALTMYFISKCGNISFLLFIYIKSFFKIFIYQLLEACVYLFAA